MATFDPRVVEEMYRVPPDAFVHERNARAAALARAGRADQARELRRLRRPAAPLWAVNQLARTEPARLTAFVDAVSRLRSAQLHGPGAVAEALGHQRAALEELVGRAAALLAGQGHRPGPALARRVSATLLGAAVDRELVDALRHGRLTAEVPAPGFEAFAGATPRPRLRIVPGGKARPTREPGPAGRARARRAEDEERRAIELEREAAVREADARQLERDVAAAAARLGEARRRLREARTAARKARGAARKAGRAR